jgi:hypothetical protein
VAVLGVHVVSEIEEALLHCALQMTVEYFLCSSADTKIAEMVGLQMVGAEVLLAVDDVLTVMLTPIDIVKIPETAVMIENVDRPETLVSCEGELMYETTVMI